MRTIVLAWAAAGAFLSWGCKPPPLGEVESRFKSELERHFRNLNVENELRKQALRREIRLAEESPVFQPPAGVIYSTYTFDPEAFVVLNFKCRVCGARLAVLIPSLEYLCPSCRHCPYREHPRGTDLRKSPCTLCLGSDQKPRPPEPEQVERKRFEDLKGDGVVVKSMFELTQPDTARPLEAVVRYIRRTWSWDPRGVVPVSVKAMEKARERNVDEKWIPVADGGSEPSQRPGFHRLDSVWIGEVKFRLTGAGLVKLSEAVEEPLRPWKDLETVK